MGINNHTPVWNRGHGTTVIKNFIRKFGAVLLVVVFIEAGFLLLKSLNVRTVAANWGSIEKGFWTEALFLREETLLKAPLDGDLIIQVDSGTRVPRGELLSYINVQLQSVNTSELNIRAQMELESLIREEQAFRVDLERIKSEIKEITMVSKNSIKKSKGPASDLSALAKEKIRITELLKETHTKLLELYHRIQDQKQQQALIMAPEPGYLFYQYDGWENKISPESFTSITEADLRREYKLETAGHKVTRGDIIGKVIHPFKQTIMISADPNKIGLPELGRNWWFKTGDRLHPVKFAGINQISGNKAIIALEDSSVDQNFLPDRRSKIFVVYQRTSGIIIPRQSIITNHNLTWVKVLKGDGFELKKVRIIESDDHNAIIEGLEFGTTIISR